MPWSRVIKTRSYGGSGDHILVGRAFQALTGDGVDIATDAGQHFQPTKQADSRRV
jgi:hypothetical protein